MTTTNKLTANDLDWEEPSISRSRGGLAARLSAQIGEMRAALSTRRGYWAVLETFDKPSTASAQANALGRRRARGESTLTGVEFAGRKMLDGGSKLYVRFAPPDGE
jgi:hypothetical protein